MFESTGAGELGVILIFGGLLGLIPAAIAHNKGASFLGWWLFGALLFIVALPLALLLKDQRQETTWAKCEHCGSPLNLIERDGQRQWASVCAACGRQQGWAKGPTDG